MADDTKDLLPTAAEFAAYRDVLDFYQVTQTVDDVSLSAVLQIAFTKPKKTTLDEVISNTDPTDFDEIGKALKRAMNEYTITEETLSAGGMNTLAQQMEQIPLNTHDGKQVRMMQVKEGESNGQLEVTSIIAVPKFCTDQDVTLTPIGWSGTEVQLDMITGPIALTGSSHKAAGLKK